MTTVHQWLCEPLPRDVAQALERLAAAPGVVHVAIMPDVHLAEGVCVGTVLGTVIGTGGRLYPQAVGSDIGCGMATVRLLADGDALGEDVAARLLPALQRQVPAVRQGRPRDAPLDELSDPALHQGLLRTARIEFGTLGRGNHFLEVQADEHDGLWLMLHSGSRAIGPAVLAHHLARAEAVGGGLRALPGDDAAWLHDHDAAVRFARANRRAIAEAAAAALHECGIDVDWPSWFDCVHNSVRREHHGERELWVHRKGASPAADGEPGIIPGSMGSRSFHVEGRGCAAALGSSSHGAGRRLPRGIARRSISARQLQQQMRGVHFDRRMAAQLLDEAPTAYKDIGAVMRAQKELVRITRTLRPLLSCKGS